MSPIGHFASAFPAKRFAPTVPLWILLAASFLLDLLYMLFAALGLERADYAPWSHSLLMSLVWTGLAGFLTYWIGRSVKNGIILGLVVWSHWAFDFLVWDTLPLFPGDSSKLGLGIWTAMGFSTQTAGANRPTYLATGMDVLFLITGITIYLIIGSRQGRAKSRSATKE